jgi:hypothetical protein
MRTMVSSSHPSRWLVLILACLVSLGTLAAPVQAAQAPAPPIEASARAATLPVVFAGLLDNVAGDRTRMVRYAFIGFAIGVAILVTATRKY